MANVTTTGTATVYDKYDPKAGGFRAALASDVDAAETPIAVGLDSSGEAEPGAAQTGIVGVLCLTSDKKAGDIVDVMTAGEMVGVAGVAAGTVITANTTTGVLSDGAASATQVKVGFTVEAARMVVRTAPDQHDAIA